MASINSFAYLQTRYPDLYRGRLLPNGDQDLTLPGIQADIDAGNFAVDGWQAPGGPRRLGYYNRTGDPYLNYVLTKTDWFNDFAPNTTVIKNSTFFPQVSFFAQEIRHGEDVEFFVRKVSDPAFGHALTLVGISCAAANYSNCSIQYQDPNNPAQLSNPAMLVGLTGTPLAFVHPVFGNVFIDAAFSESPIPAPGGILVMVLAVFLFALFGPISRSIGLSRF
jgi:hypothetical protein